jgi:outer membrane protein OmpA-like peptidoglycan-associated protein
MSFDSRENAKRVTPQEGDSLASIAAREGAEESITAEEIARFNWGAAPDQVDEFLRDELGARLRAPDKSFLLSPKDDRRGELLVPNRFKRGGFATERTHTLRLAAKTAPPQFIDCCSIPGVTFEFDKSFIRPSVVDTLQQLKVLADKHPDTKIMIFGHTDKVGSEQYNKLLSERRSKSAFAFITNDVDTWEQLFQQENWGKSATDQMLADQGFDPATNPNAVRDYQTARGLGVDGTVGPLTRKQLYKNYMTGKHDLDLAPDRFMDPKFMGCGEFNPQVETEEKNEPNRRVTFFLFNKDRLPKLPCPTAPGDIAPCKKQIAASGPRHTPSFKCSFFDSIADKCKCEKPQPPPVKAVLKEIEVKLPVTQSARGANAIKPPRDAENFKSSSAEKAFDKNAPIVLVRNCAPLELTAVTDPPNAASVAWKVVANPGPEASAPKIEPNGAKATLRTDASGGFAVSASLDGVEMFWNVVFVDVEIESSRIVRNSDQFRDTSSNGFLGVSSGVFDVNNPAKCGMFAQAKIKLTAGNLPALDSFCDKIHAGIPNVLLNDTAQGDYQGALRERERIPVETGLASPVVNPAVTVTDVGFPILDRGGAAATRATGGETIFLSNTRSTPANTTKRTVETCDSPAVGFDSLHPEFNKPSTKKITGNSGVNAFKIYLVAFSDDAKFNYTAFGHALWTADYTGTAAMPAGNKPTWTQTTAGVTGAGGTFTEIKGGQEAKDAGCEVRPPVFLTFILDAR